MEKNHHFHHHRFVNNKKKLKQFTNRIESPHTHTHISKRKIHMRFFFILLLLFFPVPFSISIHPFHSVILSFPLLGIAIVYNKLFFYPHFPSLSLFSTIYLFYYYVKFIIYRICHLSQSILCVFALCMMALCMIFFYFLINSFAPIMDFIHIQTHWSYTRTHWGSTNNTLTSQIHTHKHCDG